MTPELLALLGSFVASAFALVRYAMNQNRSLLDRFVTFLESAMQRQEQVNERFEEALQKLGENVRENSALIARMSERLELRGSSRQ